MPFGLLIKKKSASQHEDNDDDTIRTPDDRQQNDEVASSPYAGAYSNGDDVRLGGSSGQHGHDDDGSPEALLDNWLQVDDDDNNIDGSDDNEGQENRPRDNFDDSHDHDVAWLHQIDEEEHTESTDEETGTSSDDRNMPSSPSWRSQAGSQKGDLTEEERETLKNNLLSINGDNRLFVLRVQESLSRLSPEERLSMISIMRDQAEQQKEAAANKRGRCHCLCNCIVIRVMRRFTSRACLARLMSLVGLCIGAFYILAGETAKEVQDKVIGWFQSMGKNPAVVTSMPSLAPSMIASSSPSWEPTLVPTFASSSFPSAMHTSMPSFAPSALPSLAPTTLAPTIAPVSSAPMSMPPTLAPVSMSPTMAPTTEMPSYSPAISTTANEGGGNKNNNNKGNKKKKKKKKIDDTPNNTNNTSLAVEDGNSDTSNIFDPTQSVLPQNEGNGFNRKLRRRRNPSVHQTQ